jgi:hypothetical protein
MNDYFMIRERSILSAFASDLSHMLLAVRFAALTGCFLATHASAAAAISATARALGALSVSACELTLAVSVSVTSALVSCWHNSINLLEFMVVSDRFLSTQWSCQFCIHVGSPTNQEERGLNLLLSSRPPSTYPSCFSRVSMNTIDQADQRIFFLARLTDPLLPWPQSLISEHYALMSSLPKCSTLPIVW